MRWALIVAALIVLTPALAHSDELSLSTTEWYLAGTFYTLLLIDYAQTQTIMQDQAFYERNQLLGEQPRQSDVNTYFLFSAVTYLVPLFYLPFEYRMLYQGIAIGVEANVVWSNNHMGIRMSVGF